MILWDNSYIYATDPNKNVRVKRFPDEWMGSGWIEEFFDYKPFGELKNYVQSKPRFMFSSEEYMPETGMYHYLYRAYSPSLARFITRDPIEEQGGVNLYCFVNNNPVSRWDVWGLVEYRIGYEDDPNIQWDNDFPYNPLAHPSATDYQNWIKYNILLNGAEMLGYLPDATRAYRNYRNNKGQELTIDYLKFYKEDALGRKTINNAITEAMHKIEELHKIANNDLFYISGDYFTVNASTENWQKTIGGHKVWFRGKVIFNPENCTYYLTLYVKMEDLYNFNLGQQDIATGLRDIENGRFSTLGWAKQFFTHGAFTVQKEWQKGALDNVKSEYNSNIQRDRNQPRDRDRRNRGKETRI